MPLSKAARQRIEQAGWQQLLSAFRIIVRSHGHKADLQTIFVSNHISWVDIPVLGRLVGAPFVAKSDVAAWPLLGGLARHYGCVFVDRHRRSTVREQASQVRGRIAQAGRVILFPEGTTGLGNSVLPFRSALFQSVISSAGEMVQPVAICYRGERGEQLSHDRLRQIAWIDDDELLPHALALLRSRPAYVDVYFEEPRRFVCRKAAAAYCRDLVASRVARSPDIDYAPKRSK